VSLAPLTAQPQMHHLPRLDPEHYRGLAAVLWTITFERRAVGWLDPSFHATFRELLLHVAAREQLFCPVYVVMPDHIHLFWLGLKLFSDQRHAMRFLRKHIQAELFRRWPSGVEFELQKQSHDSVLREKDRTHGALSAACFYVLDNPRRKGLVSHPRDWSYLGAIVPGYPFMHPLAEDFWPLFWKLYQSQRDPVLVDPFRPPAEPSHP
jgi:putative transposase